MWVLLVDVAFWCFGVVTWWLVGLGVSYCMLMLVFGFGVGFVCGLFWVCGL